jgi:ubiquinol oxidase
MMMSRGGSSRVASTVLLAAAKGLRGGEVAAPNKLGIWMRAPAIYGGGVRNGSTLTLSEKEKHEEKRIHSSSHSASGGNKEEKGIVSYWGIQPSKITKQDGTEWKWNCFRVCILYISYLQLCFFLLVKFKLRIMFFSC